MSNKVFNALNTIRFLECRLNAPGTLPFIPGQWKNSNGFMGALIVTYETARIVCSRKDGTAMVSGLGLGLESDSDGDREQITNNLYMRLVNPSNPKLGEVGRLTRKALSILNKALYANDGTLKFIILMALFEFIATGEKQGQFRKSKPYLLPYLVKNKKEYLKLADRFKELSGHKDKDGNEIGYRSIIIHGGSTLEEILPSSEARERLFRELFSYQEIIIRNMIKDSYIQCRSIKSILHSTRL